MFFPRFPGFYVLMALLITSVQATGQDGNYFHDDFKDNDIMDGAPGFWAQGAWGGGELLVKSENVSIENCGTAGCALGMQADGEWAHYTDVSFRIKGRITDGDAAMAA